jgi:hypothetical protein
MVAIEPGAANAAQAAALTAFETNMLTRFTDAAGNVIPIIVQYVAVP